MVNLYKSDFYGTPIEVADIEGEKLVIIKDNQGRESIYSWYDTIEHTSESFYINKCLLGGFIEKTPEKVLIIGFGGGSFAKYLEEHIKNISITGIEIDKTMIDIAKKEFRVSTNDIYISDTDMAFEQIIQKKIQYDLVLIDVYGADGEMPDYFSENIFFKKLKQILKNTGTISINYANYLNKENNRLEKYENIHSQFLEYFSKNYNFLIDLDKDNGNKVGIYNLKDIYSENDYKTNYLSHVKKGLIKYDENLISDFKIIKN